MEKSTFTPQYAIFREKLVAMRRAARLNQRELAKRLGREHSFVSRIELGERRLDVVEFFWVCRACGCDPQEMMAEVARDFEKSEQSTKRKHR